MPRAPHPDSNNAPAPPPASGHPVPGDAEALKSSVASSMGLGRVFKAMRYSIEGFSAAWRHEAAFRQDLVVIAINLVFVFLAPIAAGWRFGLVAWGLGLLFAEICNSAIEACVDLVCGPERHPLAKRAKDLGSALVFLWLAIGVVLWLGALWPHLAPYF
jgi:diacylglycerol kinase (ATP)